MSKTPKVSERRLSSLLNPAGFHNVTHRFGDFAWNRWNSLQGVSEWVLVGFAGKNYEAVSASVGVGITRILAFGVKHELVLEVADVKVMLDEYGFWIPDRGKAIIESVNKAKAWEYRLAEIAPTAAECYAVQHGIELLRQTANARQRSLELLPRLDSTKSFYQQIEEFEARHGHEFRKEAERLSEWPGVMQISDSEQLYLLACCAVLTGDQGIEFFGQDPLENDELMWQIQLVTDGILSEKNRV